MLIENLIVGIASNLPVCIALRVECLLKTDSRYPKDTGVTLFSLATPGNSPRYNTHRSAPPVSALAHSRGPGTRQVEWLTSSP